MQFVRAFLAPVFLLLGVGASTSAADYECRWNEGAIVIDGRADEEAWKGAQVIDGFRQFWISRDARPKAGTRAKLLWDREYLYFSATMEDADLFAKVSQHDGKTWFDDVFEIFLKPAADKSGYYEFHVTPANVRMDLFLPKRGGDFNQLKSGHHFDFKTAVQVRGTINNGADRDNGWSVEGRLRWIDLLPTGGRPAVDEEWLFALCRYDYPSGGKDPELSSIAPFTKLDFHRHEEFPKLKFVGPAVKHPVEKRKLWTSSRVHGSPDPPSPYAVKRTFEKLALRQPLYVLPGPGTDQLWVAQHLGNWAGPGRIIRVKNDPGVESHETLLERNWLIYGFTFHPKFSENGYVYVVANGPIDAAVKKNRVSRFTVSRDAAAKLDEKSERVIIEWETDGHNGGDLGFGPDGMLYIPAGDGTSDSDKNLRGQDLRYLTSAMIRIDVDHPAPGKAYSIPKDNPFLHLKEARPEIYAYGFRNPWRMTFDREKGHLWVGNNGQDQWEQVYVVKRGENYGWSVFEGSYPFYPARKLGPTPHVKPTLEHPHSEFRSLTGGIVYYGKKFPELRGVYLYGDFSTGKIWGARYDGSKVTWHQELIDTPLQILNFAEDQNGEILIADQGNGIHRLEYSQIRSESASRHWRFPQKLSETGIFESVPTHSVKDGLVEYSVNAPLWSDGAHKQRFIGLPGESRIDHTSSRGWNFPEGAVLVKSFALDMEEGNPASRRYIETRLLVKHQNEWAGYSYIWNDEQTDAVLVEAAGRDKPFVIRDAGASGGVRTQVWHYPSRTECMVCHTRAANFVLGLQDLQMNRTHDYGGYRANQMEVLEKRGVLKVNWAESAKGSVKQELKARDLSEQEAEQRLEKIADWKEQRRPPAATLLIQPPSRITRLVDPYDPGEEINARAKSYLHANCAVCHVEAGGGNAMMELEFTTDLKRMRIVDEKPNHDAFGRENARLIAPGDPERSILYHRLRLRGPGQMPPLATSRIDDQAVQLFRRWIEQIPQTR